MSFSASPSYYEGITKILTKSTNREHRDRNKCFLLSVHILYNFVNKYLNYPNGNPLFYLHNSGHFTNIFKRRFFFRYSAWPEMDCTRHLTAPIGFVPNISHSDTEDQIGEDLEYFINTTWESPAQQQGEKQELADYLPWIGTVLEFPALKQC